MPAIFSSLCHFIDYDCSLYVLVGGSDLYIFYTNGYLLICLNKLFIVVIVKMYGWPLYFIVVALKHKAYALLATFKKICSVAYFEHTFNYFSLLLMKGKPDSTPA